MHRSFVPAALLAAAVAAAPAAAGGGPGAQTGAQTGAAAPRLSFEANRGQHDPAVRFVGRARAQRFAVGADRVAVELGGARLALVLGAPAAVRGEAPLPTRTHVLRGADPAGWIADVPHFGRVRMVGAWPGADAVLHEVDGRLEVLVELAAGADPGAVEVALEGADGLRLGDDGGLRIEVGAAELALAPPVAWQPAGAERRAVPVRYDVRGAASFGFVVEDVDPALPLAIDPVLVYATYVGGSGFDDVRALALDAAGAVLVGGSTTSPTLAGPGSAPAGGRDAFVAKLSADGSTLAWLTYLGGSSAGAEDDEAVFDLALDPEGRPVVAGATDASDFPVVAAAQPVHGGADDAFVAKLSADGASLVWSTYLGGSGYDSPRGLVVGPGGEVTVGGGTDSTDLPVQGALQPTYGGGVLDGFLARYDGGGAKLAATYLGGTSTDAVNDLALDAAGRVVAAGLAQSFAFPAGTVGQDGFFGRLAPDLGSFELLEGFAENVREVALDAQDRIFLAGSTSDFCLPVTFGAHQPGHSGSQGSSLTLVDAYVARHDAAGALERCTYYGSSTKNEELASLAVAADGTAFLALASLGSATGTAVVGRLAALDPDLSAVALELVVGSDATEARALALAADGDLVVGGTTTSAGLATPGAAQDAFGGLEDGWVRRYDVTAAALAELVLASPKVTHGGALQATVVLDGLAPAGGVAVALSTGDPLLAAPASVTVPAGALAATVQLDAGLTPAPAAVPVQASWNGTVEATVEVWHGPFYALADVLAYDPGPVLSAPIGAALDEDGRIALTRDGSAWVKEPGQPETPIPGSSYAVDLRTGGDVLVALPGGGSGLWDGATLTAAGTPNGPRALSPAGSIAGFVLGTGPWLDPAAGGSFFLPPIPGGTTHAQALDVNAADWVVGFWQHGSTFDNLAFLYRPGLGSVSLGTLLGDGSSQANAVNDAGRVAGQSYVQAGSLVQTHGFLWDEAGGMVDLPPLPDEPTARALALDGAGRAVGSSGDEAVLWDAAGAAVELAELLPPEDAFRRHLQRAVDANDAGSVLVEGRLVDANCGSGGTDALYRLVPAGPSWGLYGDGWPGAEGVPTIGLSAEPALCTQVAVQVGSPSGSPTTGLVLVGTAPAALPTPFGPVQLVASPSVVSVALSASGATLPVALPCEAALQDLVVYLQAAVVDPGASGGLAASRGLEVRLH